MAARPTLLCLSALGWFLADSVAETAGASACPGKSSVAAVGDDASLSFLQTSLHMQSPPARPHARQLTEVLPAANVRRVESALISFRALAIEDHPWWTTLVSMPLLILACLLVHRGLFRPFNWLWLLAPPFSLVGIGLLASEGEGGSVDWPVAAEAAGLTLLLTFMVLVRHAHTPEVSIKPTAGWPPPGSHGLLSSLRKANRTLHAYCEHKLKEATWIYMLAYLGLGASVLVIVIQDLLEQRYANSIAGAFLTVSMPVPNRLLYKYPLVQIRRFNMAGTQDSTSAREVNDGADAVDEWYVTPMDTSVQDHFCDFCCRLPWSWVLLYSSWYLCSEYSAYTNSAARVLALLLASLLDSFALQLNQRRRGVAQDPWQTQLWVQSRLVVTWTYLMFEGLSNRFLARHMTSEDWATHAQEQSITYIWGAGNALWGLLHLAWFVKRTFWFRRLETARENWLSSGGERRAG